MPNRIVLASKAVLSQEPELIEEVLKFLENFNENYFGSVKIEEIKVDNLVSKKIMDYAKNLDHPVVKQILKEDLDFFSVYKDDLDFDESILISLNGNSLKIAFENYDEISDKLDELISYELRESGERLHKLAKDNDGHVSDNILAYSFIERKLLGLIDENLSNLLSISTFEFPSLLK